VQGSDDSKLQDVEFMEWTKAMIHNQYCRIKHGDREKEALYSD
jgi:hypothetical protein